MAFSKQATHLAFAGPKLLCAGTLETVAVAMKCQRQAAGGAQPLVFAVASGAQVDLDLSGTVGAVRARYAASPQAQQCASGDQGSPRGRGRPRLGVVGREVTLLPRHWQWLESQRGGASAALRRLVDQARADNADQDRIQQAQERTHRFMSVIAGNLPGYEEALRALFAADRKRFLAHTRGWPTDVRQTVRALASDALPI